MYRPIEQVALRTNDLDATLRKMPESLKWITDRVQGEHVYLSPLYGLGYVGDSFTVRLAFNYEYLPAMEFELIELLGGRSCQMQPSEAGRGLAHFGYHIPDAAFIVSELDQWQRAGFRCVQVSLTSSHTNTTRRYVYAFIDTRKEVGAYTKVISRVPVGTNTSVEDLVEACRVLYP